MILAKIHQLNMGSEPYLKDFVRPGVLKIDHGLKDRQELIMKKSTKLMVSFEITQDQVFGLLRKPLQYRKQQHIELGLNIYY